MTIRKTLAASAIAGLSLAPAISFAQTAPAAEAAPAAAAPASPHTLTGNLTLASDYRFRGISQTFKRPAIQGGVDYGHSSGLYLGTWASNVSGNQYLNGNGMEWDFYGGYKGTISGDFGFDVGGLYYWYPGAHYADSGKTKYDNFELYGAVSWKWLSLKYSHTLTNFFGTKTATYGGVCENSAVGGDDDNCFRADPGNSKGSGYWDLTANYPLMDKLTLVGHVGHQSVKHYSKLNYTDWKLGVTYDLNGWMLGAAYVDTNANKGFWNACKTSSPTLDCKKLGEATLVVTVGKTF